MEEFESQAKSPRKPIKRKLKILGFTIGGLVVLGIIASIAVSAIADPAKYKPEIEKAFADATGYQLTIGGDIGVSLFPIPKAYIEGAVIANGSKQLAEVKQINVYPELLPLLSGQKKISSIVIKAPQITLEKTETGASWAKAEKPEEAAAAEKPAAEKTNLSIDSIEIEDGRIQYMDRVSGKNQILEKLNADASLAGVDGPLNFTGTVEYNGLPIDLKASISNFAEPKIFADINTETTKLKYDGTSTGGKIDLSSTDLSPMLAAAGSPNGMVSGIPLSFNGDVTYAEDLVHVTNAKFAFGTTAGTAELAAQLGEHETAASVNIALTKLNLDEILAKKAAADDTGEDEKPASKKGLSRTKAEIVATAGVVTYKNVNYKNLNTKVSIDGDNIALRPFSMETPGNGSIETFGILSKSARGWNYDGNIVAGSSNIREMVAGAGVKLDNMNPNSLKKFNITADLNAAIEKTVAINLANMKLQLDESNINGAFSVRTEKPTGISFKGTIDKINLDNYATKPPAPDAGTSGGLKGNKKLDFGWLKNLPVNANVNASIGELVESGKKYSNIRLNGTAKPGEIKMKEVSGVMGDLSVGALVELSVMGERPRFNIDANVDTIRLTQITKTEQQAETAAAKKGGQWSEKVFNFSPLDQLDGSIRAHVNSIQGDNMEFSNASLSGRLLNGAVIIEKFSGNVFGGSVSANGQLNIAAVPSMTLKFSADNIDVSAASRGLVTQWPISGRTGINANFTSSGVHQKSMIENLNGDAAINATNISVRGLDIASLAYNIANISDPLAVVTLLKNVSGGNKTTQMNSVGTIYAEKGVLKTQGLNIAADSAQGVVKGYVDLPKWYMDGDAKFNMAVGSADKKSPAFGVHLFGPPDNLQKEYDTKELEKYSAEKGLLSQKNIDLLKPGGIENKLNEKLMKQLGIKQPAASTPATAPATTTPATTPAVVPATAPATTPEATAPAAQPQAAAPAPAATTAEPQLSDKEKKKQDRKQMINQGIQSLFGQPKQ